MIGFDVRGKKGLAICEKPSIVKAIGEVYKKHKKDIPYELDFVAQRGHLLRLLNPDDSLLMDGNMSLFKRKLAPKIRKKMRLENF